MYGPDAAGWDEFDRSAGQRSAEGLRRIARYQRWVIAVVLGQLALWAGYVGLMILGGLDPMRGRPPSPDFAMSLTLILGAVGGVFVFLLSWEVRGPFAALAFGPATLVPCLGLLILTMVNGYASTELKKHGVKVGVFGANQADIRDRPNPYDADEDAGW